MVALQTENNTNNLLLELLPLLGKVVVISKVNTISLLILLIIEFHKCTHLYRQTDERAFIFCACLTADL